MRFLAIMSVFCLSLMVMPAMAAGGKQTGDLTGQASAFADNVVKQAFDTIKKKQDGKLTEQEAKVTFRKILTDAFDLPTISKFTMGRYWRVATPAEQAEFTELLRTQILDKYADSVLSYSGNGHRVTSTKPFNERDYGVAMKIDRGSEAAVDLTWRLRRIGKEFKVIDLSVEGISMSVTHRTEFGNIIERNGGKVQALLDALKSKDPKVLKEPQIKK